MTEIYHLKEIDINVDIGSINTLNKLINVFQHNWSWLCIYNSNVFMKIMLL